MEQSKGEKDGGENGAEKIKEEEEEEEKVAAISTGRPALKARARDSPAHWQKVKIVCISPLQLNAAACLKQSKRMLHLCEQGRKEKKGVKNGAKKIKVEEDEEKPSRELPVKTLNTVNRETNSRHDAEPHIASVRISCAFYFCPQPALLVNNIVQRANTCFQQ